MILFLAGATGEQPVVKDILNPTELSVKFTSNEPATEMIPDFLHIPIGEEADLLRPLSASQNASDRSNRPMKAVTRSALKKSSKSAFRTARRPLNFGVGSVRTPDGTRGRTITKSRSETQLKGLVENRRTNSVLGCAPSKEDPFRHNEPDTFREK